MNNLTLWVATTILSQKDIHQRAKRIQGFIQICNVSLYFVSAPLNFLHDFNSCFLEHITFTQFRMTVLPFFLHFPQHLHLMNNFCTLMALLNGLAHHSINRLTKTFSKVDKVLYKRLNELQEMARPGDHFRLLRDDLKKASNPCIPYL